MKAVNKRKIRLFLIILFFVIVIILGYIFLFNVDKKTSKKLQPIKKEEIQKDVVKNYKASLVMVGDSLIHSSIYYDALQSDGTYDFKPMLEYIKPIVSKYDLKYYNQETILGGSSLGYSNYPRFNSPQEVGDAFYDAGFNLVSLANNHTMDKGEIGVLNSLNYWNSKENVYTAGSYSSYEDRDAPLYKEINGIKYAFLSYTTWNNGLSTPSDKKYLNNEYSDELAKNDIDRIKDKVDVIIVAMHWGNEYSTDVSESQTTIANYLSSLGVNIIIGTHPHVIEPVEYINDGKTLVIYSLGNFISDQVGIDRLSGLMVSLDINKEEKNDISTISINNLKANIIYTSSSNTRKRNFKVYPYSKLDNYILNNYNSYNEHYKSIVASRNVEISFEEMGE